MLQLDNSTPFESCLLLFPNARGIDTLYVVVKATFQFFPTLQVADEQRPISLGDAYWGEPGLSSLKYPNEAHLEKPGTDVIVVADVCAPNDRPAAQVDVGIAVAGTKKSTKKIARVFGDRIWERGPIALRPSAPQPFTRMPLVYERAFGGQHVLDAAGQQIVCEPRNPVGRGFRGKRSADALAAEPLPNIEDPRALLQHPGAAPDPVGFGAVAPAWAARAGFAGTYDEKWQSTRAPYLPHNFDPQFFHCAPPGWTWHPGLRGGESVSVVGLSPRGAQRFAIPRCELRIDARIAGLQQAMAAHLETVLLEPTQDRLSLTWRAALPCDKQTMQVQRVYVQAAIQEA